MVSVGKREGFRQSLVEKGCRRTRIGHKNDQSWVIGETVDLVMKSGPRDA